MAEASGENRRTNDVEVVVPEGVARAQHRIASTNQHATNMDTNVTIVCVVCVGGMARGDGGGMGDIKPKSRIQRVGRSPHRDEPHVRSAGHVGIVVVPEGHRSSHRIASTSTSQHSISTSMGGK